MNIELWILDALQGLHSPIMDRVMVGISTLGNAGMIWILLAVVLLIRKKTRPLGCVLAVSLFVDVILCNAILKNLFARPRPFTVNTMVDLLVAKPKDYSFPSGHTAASFTAVFALWCAKERHGLFWSTLGLAVLIAFSRMYLYVHYPTDILGGVLVGGIAGYAGARIVEMIRNKVMKTQAEK